MHMYTLNWLWAYVQIIELFTYFPFFTRQKKKGRMGRERVVVVVVVVVKTILQNDI